jgi:hypothetical protein
MKNRLDRENTRIKIIEFQGGWMQRKGMGAYLFPSRTIGEIQKRKIFLVGGLA